MPSSPWESCSFPGRFRRYQRSALEAVDGLRAAGECQAYVVMPPGSGKTVLGLEAARRIGRRTLVLTPNTAVQAQWLRQWEQFGGTARHPQPGSASRNLDTGLTVLTYQSLSVWDRTADDEDDIEDDRTGDLAERRRAAVRGEAGSELLDLLHPHGRRLIEKAAGLGPWTLVLDECHHLLETWGALVRALVRALGEQTWVLGLTATPPQELTARQRALHDELFGDRDFCVPTPAVVKEGELAPYQELAYLTTPTSDEDTWIVAERTRFSELQMELLTLATGTLPFLDWLTRRIVGRSEQEGGPQLAWADLERGDPALARAALRLVHAGMLERPAGARLREEHRAAPDGRDWAALLAAYALEHLTRSTDSEDLRLLAALRRVLPGLGWMLTVRGLRATTSPVDRVCALSASKAAAATHILEAESAALGKDLRAVVLCDFEQRTAQQSTRLRDASGAGPSGSARLAFLVLAWSDLAPVLRPVLCTGRTLGMRREDLPAFRAFVPPSLADRILAEPLEGVRSLVTLTAGPGWSARVWTPLVTDWLVSGGCHVVVGTRGLLGEGWDCPPLNVVIDLSSAATATSVTQLRGRSLRLDPARPDKVADNWTVACVADDHPRGAADYLRAVRKHDRHLAPGADGLVESGIGHCDPALEPYVAPDPQERAAVNARALERAASREQARLAWAVGTPSAGFELRALQIRAERPLGLPGGIVSATAMRPTTTLGTSDGAPLPPRRRASRLWPLPVGSGAAASAAGTVTASPEVGVAAGLGTAALVAGGLTGRRYLQQLRALDRVPQDGQSATLRQLASAVADALHTARGTVVGAEAVRVHGVRNGWLSCELEAPAEQSELFATCLDELLAPLAQPRWLVSRLVLPVPAARSEQRRLARARALGRPVEAAVAWHAVPTWLGRNRARLVAFDAAWQTGAGGGRLVSTKDGEGAALLELLRGTDPFALTSRLRTLWR